MKKLVFLAMSCSLLAGSAHAGGDESPRSAIALLTPVHYAEESNAKAAVKADCALEKSIETDTLDALRAHGRAPTSVASSAAGRVLEITIERVTGLGGGGWTGAKGLSVKARILADGKSVHATMASYDSKGLNPLGGNCGALQRDSGKIGEQLARWLDDVDAADAARPPAPAAAGSAPSSAGT